MANALIHESSPYLLQHAHNPVDWHPWGEDALRKARQENKLILVSIGYAACHWCHVMEHECFEDEAVAMMMNAHFINIKVDREERPDIDQVYMDAVMIMNRHGGWPLNCITLPDGRPVYGGTYYPKPQWLSILAQLSDLWERQPDRMIDYASQLVEGLQSLDHLVEPDTASFQMKELEGALTRWKSILDREEGGNDRAPKFPMPNNWQFLQRAAHFTEDKSLQDAITLTLRKMALGGMYDQLGGGFARYSVDRYWRVPHFEKMLYDNGQLVTLYCEAYRRDPQPLYADVVQSTLDWVMREMLSPEGGFYSSLDADSEGEEGKFYVWTTDEINSILGEDSTWFCDLCTLTPEGNWEHGNNVVHLRTTREEFAAEKGWTNDEMLSRWTRAMSLLMEHRTQRVRPGLDDKILASWNALMLRGLTEAAITFGRADWLAAAERNAAFILEKMCDGSRLWRNYKNGKASINAFLDDYALCIDAFVFLYGANGDEALLHKAQEWTSYALTHFFDGDRSMFFYTSDLDAPLVTRKLETMDNVIPSSNSVMAHNLFHLSRLLGRTDYEEMALAMLRIVRHQIPDYGSSYSNWGQLLLKQLYPYREVAITGPGSIAASRELQRHYLPHALCAPTERESQLALLQGRFESGQLRFFVCENKVCNLPVKQMETALSQLGHGNKHSL